MSSLVPFTSVRLSMMFAYNLVILEIHIHVNISAIPIVSLFRFPITNLV